MEHTAALDFPFPNEIIEKVTGYLSTEDLFDLTDIGSERLKKFTFGVLRKKLRGKHKLMSMLKLILL